MRARRRRAVPRLIPTTPLRPFFFLVAGLGLLGPLSLIRLVNRCHVTIPRASGVSGAVQWLHLSDSTNQGFTPLLVLLGFNVIPECKLHLRLGILNVGLDRTTARQENGHCRREHISSSSSSSHHSGKDVWGTCKMALMMNPLSASIPTDSPLP